MEIIAYKKEQRQDNTKGDKMRFLIVSTLMVLASLTVDIPGNVTFPGSPFKTENANAAVRYVRGYSRSNGTYVSGHYRDTSNDGYSYNNANTLGYND